MQLIESIINSAVDSSFNKLPETPQSLLLRYLREASVLGKSSTEAAAEALGELGLHPWLEMQPLGSEPSAEDLQTGDGLGSVKEAFVALVGRLSDALSSKASHSKTDVVEAPHAETVFKWMSSERFQGTLREQREQRSRWSERWQAINGISKR